MLSILTVAFILLFVGVTKEKNPGVKFGFPKLTMEYMIAQIMPWVEKELKSITFPTIDKRVGKRGHIEITLSGARFEIVSENSIKVILTDVHMKGDTPCHYDEHAIPHLHGHGNLNLELLADISVVFGAKLDFKHKSNLELYSSNVTLTWKEFNIGYSGDLHRIFNWVLSDMKGSLENTVKGIVAVEVPKAVTGFLQPIIDSIPFSYPIGLKDLDFSYLIEEIKFNKYFDYLMFGAVGALMFGHISDPGEVMPMPDVLLETSMVHVLISEWSLTSSMWAANRAGLLEYVVHDNHILPIHLNTESMGMIIPGLMKYGNKEMQVKIESKVGTYPVFFFTPGKLRVIGFADAIFQVLNSSTEVIDAFTLEGFAECNATVRVVDVDDQVKVSIGLGLEHLNISLVHSDVGTFDPSILQHLFVSMLDYFILPMLNKYFLEGLPIPSTKFFKPINPKIVMAENHALVTMDFEFYPPQEE